MPGQPGLQNDGLEESEEPKKSPQTDVKQSKWGPTLFKMFESAATTMASILVLGYVSTDSSEFPQNH